MFHPLKTHQSTCIRRRRKSPAGVIFVAAAILAAGGAVLLIRAQRRAPVLASEIDRLAVRLERARWMTDQMDHGGGFARPAAMMPGMPEPGAQRLSVEIALHNVGNRPVEYRGEEFSLVSSLGKSYGIYGADLGEARLNEGRRLNTALYFDVGTAEDLGRLLLVWQRGGKSVYMPLPAPPVHYHAQPRGDVIWPADVGFLLPVGNFERGAALYGATFGCIACHGDLDRPGTNLLGPHLGGIGNHANQRVEGQNGPQYLYESILRPNDFIVDECRPGVPCSTPSAMPDYGEILSLQDMADLVSYLARQVDSS